ncbi:ModE molybdate transport repressor domain-containing protein [Fontimonas thermophila]|uniref:ModE molybdate transport repressor domain-containing protein n=1 Tax=Fontimonas thermophila TaxID=1076937 RepID=A0A1I2H4C8_9GAMM|nr:LysR family transcriptional regulator [Fontimonas thermophila]SFF24189.1 ModE molybdate transport repressor domain-containing protein [Fontimonas thermophila]
MPDRKYSVRSQFWLMAGDEALAGPGRIELLRLIQATGSIRQAALAMGMSYRAAWDAVDAMNKRAGAAVVTRLTGGRSGGGARLTEHGQRLIRAYARLEDDHRRHLARMNAKLARLLR